MFDNFLGMTEHQKKLVVNILLAGFEYILGVGEDTVCKDILDKKVDLSIYPNIQKRVDEYVKRRSDDYQRML